ncbi:MAG: exonuclease domain-containing protein [bacterium]|nr:exonuclease domain-containing protein [bacterium]
MSRIFLDLEYLYPGMTKKSGRPTGRQRRQVVQIAAIRVDSKGKEIDKFDMLTIPTYTEELPAFFTELTGITQRDVDRKAVPFEDGLSKLKNFCKGTPVWTFDKDYEVLEQNCKYIKVKLGLKKFERVKPRLKNWDVEASEYSSGTLYKVDKVAKVRMRGHVHNALHDVRSMSRGLHFLEAIA